jgi:GNAT superfamily N-acetyltransferase
MRPITQQFNAQVPQVTIRRIESPEDIAASQALRFRVWSEQEGVELKNEESGLIADELDATAYHWGAFEDDKLIGSARLSVHHELVSIPDIELYAGLSIPLPTASLNRLVVEQAIRGKGIARMLDEHRIQFARNFPVKSIIVAPVNRKSRVDSLLTLGLIKLDNYGVTKWSKTPVAMTAMYLLF